MATPFDWDDAAARLTALREAYFKLLTGTKETRVLFRSGDSHQQEIVFNDANMKLLKEEIREAETELGKRKRFAITFGARR